MKRTLMLQNQELLEFDIDLGTAELRIVDAPCADDELLRSAGFACDDLEVLVAHVVKGRLISRRRDDVSQILDAFGVSSLLELAFRGHGLSLIDHLWYRAPGSVERWEDINFFDNDWDGSFGAAVLTRDYKSMASCSLDTPDITTQGHLLKTWERTKDGIRLLKEPLFEDGRDVLGAQLASQLCCLLYGQDAYQPLFVVERFGQKLVASPLMVSRDEELVQGYRLFTMGGFDSSCYEQLMGPSTPQEYAEILSRVGVAGARAHVAKMSAFKSLSLLADMHAGNFGIIRNPATGAVRPTFPFDYDRAFGFPYPDFPMESFCKNPGLVALICARTFSDLDSSWDWSWYDPRVLDGFEACILETYENCDGLPADFGTIVSRVFVMQRDYVNAIAGAK